MHPAVQILVFAWWIYISYEICSVNIRLSSPYLSVDVIKAKTMIWTALLVVLPIFIGTIIKDVF